ncbi:peptidyl-prolyl cis-trans isomerase [Sulfurimicrobium lacus]|uniref:Peptidyl-prolyl cis-trans isomerase n=1 Tax=Sulfurimicrobium lacus TaxID=2715678 RepID=A0A6F8VEB6_9PROT|nr:peptidylprolyl isomerase [Sulfurimicrobium lacus]BCB28024.1 peptidyl-prolyl cis-trans isomerase [Sulfurimicrobium lacus]
MSHFRFLLSILALLASFSAQSATNPQVMIKTNLGEMVVELYPQKAPKTVENFLHYVKNGFYNGTIFHRVINDFMIQGGGLTPAFEQKATFPPIPNEADNGLKNEPGTLAMAHAADPNSATAQFFINLDQNKHLDFYKPESYYYGYCVFGKVIKGLDVAKKIGAIPTSAGGPFASDVPQEKIVIEEVAPITLQAAAEPATDKKTSKQPTRKKKDVKHG